jgi:two-component sensor histidine kinase
MNIISGTNIKWQADSCTFWKKALLSILLGILSMVFCNTSYAKSTSREFSFTRFSIFDTKGEEIINHTHDLDIISKIVVPAQRKFLEVEFFSTPPSINTSPHYFYSLTPSSKQWIPIGEKTTLTFHSLNKGIHTLSLKVEYPQFPEYEKIISKEIHVKAFFHETWWPLISILFILLLILVFIKGKQKQFLKKKQDLRTKISSDLHDEIGGTLTRISLGIDLLSAGLLDSSEEEQVLQKVSELGHNVTSIISDVIWFEDDNRQQNKFLIDKIKEEAQLLFEPANINFSLQTTGIDSEAELPMEYRRNIYLVFKEALNNIIKHSNADKVSILFLRENNTYILQVSDNGSQSVSNAKQGQGLTNMLLRAQRINGNVNISQEGGYSIRLEAQLP